MHPPTRGAILTPTSRNGLSVRTFQLLSIAALVLVQGCATPPNMSGGRGTNQAPSARTTESAVAQQTTTRPRATSSEGFVPLPPKENTPQLVIAPIQPVVRPPANPPFQPSVIPPTPDAPRVRPVVPAPIKPAAPKREGTAYTVKKGDMISKIAVAHGISSKELAEYNAIKNPNDLRVGQTITIPPHSRSKSAPSAPKTTTPSSSANLSGIRNQPGPGTYEVKSGDILGRIAQAHGVKVADLKKWNNLSGDSIRVGQVLKVSADGSAPAATPRSTQPSTPTTPAAPPASASIDALLGGLERPRTPTTPPPAALPPLTPPPSTTPPATAAPAGDASLGSIGGRKPYEYTVVESDTVASIARSFIVTEGSIRRLNNLGPEEEVRAGQKIKIPTIDF